MSSYNCCKPDEHTYRQVTTISSLLKLVGEESRLKILCILMKGQHCVCEILEHLKLSQSLVSHHLQDLKTASLIVDEKKGQYVYYSLTEEGKRVTKLIFQL